MSSVTRPVSLLLIYGGVYFGRVLGAAVSALCPPQGFVIQLQVRSLPSRGKTLVLSK